MTVSTDAAFQKRALRKRLRLQRNALSAEHRIECEAQALSHLVNWLPWNRAALIGSYLPHESEFDPMVLTARACERGAKVVCPRVQGNLMSFHHWRYGDDTEITVGGVLQPATAAPAVDAATIDLFLTPLLACGENGMRLGYGGGFYDRLFAEVGGLRLGVGFAMQRVGDWEIESHDQMLDGFLSEEGVTLFK